MNAIQIEPSVISAVKTVPLYKLVNELLSCYANVNKTRRKLLTNDVPRHLCVTTTADWLAPLMGDLFMIINSNPEDMRLSISARLVEKKIHLYAKNG